LYSEDDIGFICGVNGCNNSCMVLTVKGNDVLGSNVQGGNCEKSVSDVTVADEICHTRLSVRDKSIQCADTVDNVNINSSLGVIKPAVIASNGIHIDGEVTPVSSVCNQPLADDHVSEELFSDTVHNVDNVNVTNSVSDIKPDCGSADVASDGSHVDSSQEIPCTVHEVIDHSYMKTTPTSTVHNQSLFTDLISEESINNILGCSVPDSQFYKRDLPSERSACATQSLLG